MQTQGMAEDEKVSSEDNARLERYAVWSLAISISIAMATLCGIALLNRPLDEPDTLKVNNRYVRLAPRVIYIIVAICVLIKKDINPQIYIGLVSLMLILLMWIEWIFGLEKTGGIFEPKDKSILKY